jgi:hypothetical protein
MYLSLAKWDCAALSPQGTTAGDAEDAVLRARGRPGAVTEEVVVPRVKDRRDE